MKTNVPAGIRVTGVDAARQTVISAPLGHGMTPEALLGGLGWRAERPVGAQLAADDAVELLYAVSPLASEPPVATPTLRDSDVAADEVGEATQRVGAYAVVRGAAGVLLTQFNAQTGIPGEWGLPGGGLDPSETPVDGVHREVWEETGQRIVLGPLVHLQSQHWVGRAPSGVVENYHAVRIVYRATCPEPTAIVIHDIGGTTADARWVSEAELGELPMTASWRTLAELTSARRRLS